MYDKSINIFETYSEYENIKGALLDITLNYIRETNETLSVKKPNYFYIESLEDNNKISFGVNDTWFGTYKSNIYYSFNLYQWFSLSLITNLTLSKNQKVYFKGDGTDIQKSEIHQIPLFKTTHKFNVGGNIKEVLNPNTTLNDYGYNSIFYNNSLLVDASKLMLPATTLADWCYYEMFKGCTSLTQAPELPATELADWCYYEMFKGCTSLTQAPELPATTLAESCYQSMFQNCTSLVQAPELPATTLADLCYYEMFEGCTSLTQAPELPATELANCCYVYMFSNCTSLTQAPALPATTLAISCYSSMFSNCTSLTQAPALPATELADGCYLQMFFSCTNLTESSELPATVLKSDCYVGMFQGCSSLTAAPQLPATKLAYRCYQDMFQCCSNLNYIKCLATDISASDCTNNWVYGVAKTGTFYKHPDMNDWTTGEDGIPIGWVVEDVDLPVTFTAQEDNSSIGLEKLSTNQTLEYSTDTTTWNTFDTDTNIPLNNGDKVYIRGVLSADNTSSNYTQFKMTGKIAASGNCNALWNYNDLEAPLKEYCGYNMFYDCTSLTKAPELPATALVKACYQWMFYGCTSLTTAPELPATTLADWCYNSMFYNCTSLVQAPELPATKLTEQCYQSMFNGCNNLNYIKCLATDISASNCTYQWTNGVASTGIFIKHSNMNSWTTGVSGIPADWTVEDYAE